MSNYFSLIPNFEYVSRLPNAKISDYITVKNLFKRVFLREDIYQNLTFFQKYTVKGDDRPDNVAEEIYKDSTLDWLILLANNIVNIPNEWPLPQADFDRYLLDKYDNDYNKIYNGVHHYETVEVSSDYNIIYFDYWLNGMTEENDITRPITNFDYEHNLENKKRELFILRPEYISVVLDDINDISKYKKGSTEYVDETLKRAENIRLFQ